MNWPWFQDFSSNWILHHLRKHGAAPFRNNFWSKLCQFRLSTGLTWVQLTPKSESLTSTLGVNSMNWPGVVILRPTRHYSISEPKLMSVLAISSMRFAFGHFWCYLGYHKPLKPGCNPSYYWSIQWICMGKEKATMHFHLKNMAQVFVRKGISVKLILPILC